MTLVRWLRPPIATTSTTGPAPTCSPVCTLPAARFELIEIYADFPLGTTDAAVVAVAERLGVAEIATLDHRHFHAVRPRHVGSFDLLP